MNQKNISSALWYPYAPLKTMSEPLKVKKAHGSCLTLENDNVLIDAIASWWCVLHGYNHPRLNKALVEQSQKMAHVMMGGLEHSAAADLSAKLVNKYPGMKRCFFADSGSVGVEVGLKMAAQYWWNLGYKNKQKFVALENGYHGDTLGTMAVGEPDDIMRTAFGDMISNQFFVPAPYGKINETNEQLEFCLTKLEETFKKHQHQLAGFVVEPIMQGYGGMQTYPAEYLNQARILCDKYDVLFIFDEVATGFGRTGKTFAVEHTDVLPDIAILGKALSGGYLGISATLANERVEKAFWSDDPNHALMHGPTFMGNALACAVSLESLAVYEDEDRLSDAIRIETHFKRNLENWKNKHVKDIRILGAMFCIEVFDSKSWSGLREYAANQGLWIRPFQNFVYSMPPFVISNSEINTLCTIIKEWFESK
jgi:adenosylmethionine---8-amino-7-oxononanoate aminotransferase